LSTHWTRIRHTTPRRIARVAGNGAHRGHTLYVTSQILCEFYSIVTNPRRVPKPRTPGDAATAVAGLLGFLRVLPVPVHAVGRWLNLLQRHPVTGGDIFDMQLIATMQANGVQRIYTFNTGDFDIFPELSVVTP
jgi:predicted nucleic acid-binding protein